MRIQAFFHLRDSDRAFAHTGVEDGVTDLILPLVGDTVSHKDLAGRPFSGVVIARDFHYDMPAGEGISGVVSVTLILDRVTMH